MTRAVHVHLLPALVDPAELAGGTVVVVDVLRASTTICHALAAGARHVVPVGAVDEARRLATESDVVLGGERGGEVIEGFDLGNSPTSYTPETVGGRTVVFTTTNGTRALLHAATADRILVGCFANETAIVRDVLAQTGPVHVLCAGTNGAVTLEDVLFAGSVAHRLQTECGFEIGDDSGRLAAALFTQSAPRGDFDERLASLRESRGGRNLLRLGFDDDLRTAAALDTFDVLPVFDPRTGLIETT